MNTGRKSRDPNTAHRQGEAPHRDKPLRAGEGVKRGGPAAPEAPPAADPVTEQLVMSFLDLIAERKLAGKRELAATMATIATWLSERTGLAVQPAHIQTLTTAMREAGLITVGGGGIGLPNTYDTCEREMGSEAFWQQVDAFLLVWKHPSRKAIGSASQVG